MTAENTLGAYNSAIIRGIPRVLGVSLSDSSFTIRWELAVRKGRGETLDTIVGASLWARQIRDQIKQVSAHTSSVLITGPSGTGKELIARAIHDNSPRRNKPFIPVDCTSIPHSLAASQLFGHVKGAFTGADKDSVGCFRAADGGTIFLDEIGELELELQAKLLRVIQERVVVPVGTEKGVQVDVRIVAATNRDLQEEVRAGRFRLDLFYRLNVVPLHSMPLSNRKEDTSLLAQHFLNKLAIENGLPSKKLSQGGIAVLQEYSWPGNVRELQNTVERAVVFSDNAEITADEIRSVLTPQTSNDGDRQPMMPGGAPQTAPWGAAQTNPSADAGRMTQYPGSQTVPASQPAPGSVAAPQSGNPMQPAVPADQATPYNVQPVPGQPPQAGQGVVPGAPGQWNQQPVAYPPQQPPQQYVQQPYAGVPGGQPPNPYEQHPNSMGLVNVPPPQPYGHPEFGYAQPQHMDEPFQTLPLEENELWPTLAKVEYDLILKTLEHTDYNRALAARLLGIDYRALSRKIYRFRLDKPRGGQRPQLRQQPGGAQPQWPGQQGYMVPGQGVPSAGQYGQGQQYTPQTQQGQQQPQQGQPAYGPQGQAPQQQPYSQPQQPAPQQPAPQQPAPQQPAPQQPAPQQPAPQQPAPQQPYEQPQMPNSAFPGQPQGAPPAPTPEQPTIILPHDLAQPANVDDGLSSPSFADAAQPGTPNAPSPPQVTDQVPPEQEPSVNRLEHLANNTPLPQGNQLPPADEWSEPETGTPDHASSGNQPPMASPDMDDDIDNDGIPSDWPDIVDDDEDGVAASGDWPDQISDNGQEEHDPADPFADPPVEPSAEERAAKGKFWNPFRKPDEE